MPVIVRIKISYFQSLMHAMLYFVRVCEDDDQQVTDQSLQSPSLLRVNGLCSYSNLPTFP